jgi:hypothetical protein
MRKASLLVLLLACGKTTAAPTVQTESPSPQASAKPADDQRITITGKVHLAGKDPTHNVTPVEIEADDGTRWLASYHTDDLWKEFDGRRIVATCVKYVPEGQALVLPHVRVEKWRLEKATFGDLLVDVGPEITLRGKFEVRPDGPPGSKGAESKGPHFVEDSGKVHPVAHGTPPEMGRAVEIKARFVELSPFTAHVGSPHLWVLSVS